MSTTNGDERLNMSAADWSYALLPWEEALCARIGYERQLPYMGKPHMNRNYSEGDVWEIWQHAVAAGSELAFARMVGLTDFVPHVNKWRTEQDVPGFEIRYSFKRNLRMHELDENDKIYVLLVDGLAIKSRRYENDGWLGVPYKAIGWMYGHQAKQDKYFNPTIGGYKNWYVPADDLNSMNLLQVSK